MYMHIAYCMYIGHTQTGEWISLLQITTAFYSPREYEYTQYIHAHVYNLQMTSFNLSLTGGILHLIKKKQQPTLYTDQRDDAISHICKLSYMAGIFSYSVTTYWQN